MQQLAGPAAKAQRLILSVQADLCTQRIKQHIDKELEIYAADKVAHLVQSIVAGEAAARDQSRQDVASTTQEVETALTALERIAIAGALNKTTETVPPTAQEMAAANMVQH